MPRFCLREDCFKLDPSCECSRRNHKGVAGTTCDYQETFIDFNPRHLGPSERLALRPNGSADFMRQKLESSQLWLEHDLGIQGQYGNHYHCAQNTAEHPTASDDRTEEESPGDETEPSKPAPRISAQTAPVPAGNCSARACVGEDH